MRYPFFPFKIDAQFGAVRSYGYHSGIDLNGLGGGNTDLNTPLFGISSGKKIESSLSDRAYGNILVYELRGPWGTYWCRYCHLNSINPVDVFTENIVVAYMGSTGSSTAAHLHIDLFIKKPPFWRFSAATIEQLHEYFIDPVVFFDTYKDFSGGGIDMPATDSSIYKGLDLSNKESMKVAVDVWDQVVHGGKELLEKEVLDKLREESKKLGVVVEKLKGVEVAHEQEIIALKQQFQQQTKDETIRLKSIISDQDTQISTLNKQVLNTMGDWKSRFLSRKFLLAASTALFDLMVAVAILLGAKPDPGALAQVLTALHTAVALFAIPEAISDHQERMAFAPKS